MNGSMEREKLDELFLHAAKFATSLYVKSDTKRKSFRLIIRALILKSKRQLCACICVYMCDRLAVCHNLSPHNVPLILLFQLFFFFLFYATPRRFAACIPWRCPVSTHCKIPWAINKQANGALFHSLSLFVKIFR